MAVESWQKTMRIMVRYLINDFDLDDLKYSDSDLNSLLATSAMYVKQEINLDTTYTITINPPDIDPDPTLTASKNDTFTNFVVLKAACLTDEWEMRSKAIIEGINAVCGPGKMSVAGGAGKGLDLLINNGPCGTYDKLKFEFNTGNSTAISAIMTPFVSNLYNPLSDNRRAVRG